MPRAMRYAIVTSSIRVPGPGSAASDDAPEAVDLLVDARRMPVTRGGVRAHRGRSEGRSGRRSGGRLLAVILGLRKSALSVDGHAALPREKLDAARRRRS